MNNSGSNVLVNFFWRFAERVGAQFVQLLVSIVLARILAPTDYGAVALMNVFINILGVFINCGLGSALIQKKDADETDFSTVFYAQMVFCVVLYGILFVLAPYIAAFYEDPEMSAMVRVTGLIFLLSGVRNVQNAYVSRTMQFKRFFFATLGGTIGAAFVGIGMAVAGWGAWALIGQSLFNNTIDTIILWFTVRWRPAKKFSFARLKVLFSYSWKLLFSAVLDTVYNNLRSLIIGKVYSSEDLAYYNRGKSWPALISENVDASVTSVLFPSMSKVQEDPAAVKAMMRRAITVSTYVIAPMMMGLAFCGTPLVRLVLTPKWLPSVPFLWIFCIVNMFFSIHTANLTAIKAMGRSDLFLRLEILKKVIGLIALVVTVPISVMAMGYSLLFTSVTGLIINSWPNKKLLNYGYLEQMKDILPNILLAVGMGCCVYAVQRLGLSDLLTLCIQVPLGVAIYVGASVLLKLETFTYLWGIVKPILVRIMKR